MGVESFEGAEVCSADSRVAARRRCGRVGRAAKACGSRHDDRRPLRWYNAGTRPSDHSGYSLSAAVYFSSRFEVAAKSALLQFDIACPVAGCSENGLMSGCVC